MSLKSNLQNIYENKYKKLLIIPIILLALAIVQIAAQTIITGDFVNKGVSLKGGSIITITTDANPATLQSFLAKQFPGADISVRSLTQAGQIIGLSIESDAQSEQEMAALLSAIKENIDLTEEDFTVEITGSTLGASFFRQTFTAIIIAFILMALVVLAYFRTIIPSLAVVLAAFSDIVITLAIFNLTGIKLSTAGIAAFLMLIGYSVDTDILLTSRVFKRREGTIMDRIYSAMKTGFTMTFTTLTAIIVAIIFTNSPVIKQIMIILLIGLLVDLINTWIQNVGLIRLYIERKNVTNQSD